MVSHQCEVLNVSASYANLQGFLFTGSMEMVSLQCERVNVNVIHLSEQMILYTGGRYMVSHLCELLNVNNKNSQKPKKRPQNVELMSKLICILCCS